MPRLASALRLPCVLGLVILSGGLARSSRGESPPDRDREPSETLLRLRALGLPVRVISREEILATGQVSLEQVLQRQPWQANALNAQFNNGGNGASRVSLRSLGSTRSLVLLNGRRFVPGGDGANSSVDLNALPLSVVERIEILTGSASALYGSGAITGVINIVTRKSVEGVEATAYSRISDRGDARTYQVDATASVETADERGRALFSAAFFDREPVFAGEREFSQLPRGFDFRSYQDAGSPADDQRFRTIGGSIARPRGRIVDRSLAPGNEAWQNTGCAGGICVNDSIEFRPQAPGDTYNFRPETYLVTPSRRWSFMTEGEYRFGSAFQVFFEGLFNHRESQQWLAPLPFSTLDYGLVLSADQPFNPFGRDFRDVRWRTTELGNRTYDQTSLTYRLTVGSRGTLTVPGLSQPWRWELALDFGRTETSETGEGQVVLDRLRRALGPAADCGSPCVSLNLFSLDPFGATREMVNYLRYTALSRGFTEQRKASAQLAAPLFELLAAEEPVTVRLRYDFRQDEGGSTPDPRRANRSSTALGATPYGGAQEVHAGSAEIVMPVVSAMPFLERVELSAALRYSGFDGSFDNLSYHAGAVWSPLPGLTLRATAASAFRAPSIRDLFLGPQDDFPSIADPCALRVGRLESPLVAANCEADGLGAGVQDDRTQLRQQRVGNPNLEPETAETFGLGLVLEDLPLRGLRLTLDYYDHVISDGIRVLEAREILSACYDRDFRGFCDNVVRSSAGTIDSVLTPTVNASLVSARGLDASLRYQSPETAAGRFGLGLDGTLALDLDFGSGSVVDSYSSGVQAAYRIQAFVDWAWRFLGANLQLRYLPGIDECPGGCLNTSQFRRVSDYLQLDLQLSAAFVTPLGTTRFSGGLLNLSDTEPPFVAVAFGPASDRRNYDFVGRQFYLRITQAF